MALPTAFGGNSATTQRDGTADRDAPRPSESIGWSDRPSHTCAGRPEAQSIVRDRTLRTTRLTTALLLTSISALVAAIAALVICALLVVAIVHLNADIQGLVSAPSQSQPGGFVP